MMMLRLLMILTLVAIIVTPLAIWLYKSLVYDKHFFEGDWNGGQE